MCWLYVYVDRNKQIKTRVFCVLNFFQRVSVDIWQYVFVAVLAYYRVYKSKILITWLWVQFLQRKTFQLRLYPN
jgi:hypothetical protein